MQCALVLLAAIVGCTMGTQRQNPFYNVKYAICCEICCEPHVYEAHYDVTGMDGFNTINEYKNRVDVVNVDQYRVDADRLIEIINNRNTAQDLRYLTYVDWRGQETCTLFDLNGCTYRVGIRGDRVTFTKDDTAAATMILGQGDSQKSVDVVTYASSEGMKIVLTKPDANNKCVILKMEDEENGVSQIANAYSTSISDMSVFETPDSCNEDSSASAR